MVEVEFDSKGLIPANPATVPSESALRDPDRWSDQNSGSHPTYRIGEDKLAGLVQWPADRGGVGGVPSKTIGLRVTDDERVKWQRAADVREQSLAGWARDELNAAAARTLTEADAARPRSKGKP